MRTSPTYVETLKFPGPHPVRFPGLQDIFASENSLVYWLAWALSQVCLTSVSEGSSNTDVFTLPLQVSPWQSL